MLSKFSKYQQSLVAAYWALADAAPPEKRELKRAMSSISGRVNHAHAGILIRGHEDFSAAFQGAVGELTSSAGRRYIPDWDRRGTGLPSQRKVRAS